MGEEEKGSSEGGHFVLIHGVGGGGWCCYKIRSLMENSGYIVTSLDLKGAGIDPSDPNTILSFHDYNKPLLHFLSSLPHNEQVILVGHSAGGLSVTDATHKLAKKVKLAVYIAATMLRNGFMSEQDVKDDSTLAAMLLRPGPFQIWTSERRMIRRWQPENVLFCSFGAIRRHTTQIRSDINPSSSNSLPSAISFRGIWLNKHRLVCMFFMNSRSTAAATLSCKAGNENSSLFWNLVCLFPQFFGTLFAVENFLLFKAIVRGLSTVVLS
ncbi:hypothetical protein HAX54_022728 [Datura stramonium]|uniref:AB hydrolase-1 domain-containing protein n=1 Tax=Datura stramonium TaxID=4076 RepID=A0ABS8UUT1_DATST|nr:hypothetical protein [Datura stramonium]